MPNENINKPFPPSNAKNADAFFNKDLPLNKFGINPVDLFSAKWNLGSQTYRSRFDEATRNSWDDTVAMRRDCYIEQLLMARFLPVSGLTWHLEADEPSDLADAICEDLMDIIGATPGLQKLFMALQEAVFYGYAGAALKWDHKRINGKDRLIIADHSPIQGDKIMIKWADGMEGTPGVLVYRALQDPELQKLIEPTDRGPAIFLTTPYFRDRYIFHGFLKRDMDYILESDEAGRLYKGGLRHNLYWIWTQKMSLMAWIMDFLQRYAANGLFFGAHETGNAAAQQEMLQVLQDITRNCVATVPMGADEVLKDKILHIPVTQGSLDPLYEMLRYCDTQMRELVLGQTLSATHEGGGLGTSSAAKFHETTLTRILRFDAVNLGNTLTTDLVEKLIKYNYGQLPFGIRWVFEVEASDVKEKLESAKILGELGVSMSQTGLRTIVGVSAPEDEADSTIPPGTVDDREDSKPGLLKAS